MPALTKEQRRDIAGNYWFFILLAVGLIASDALIEKEVMPGTYWAATFCIIHAHGHRIRETLLALHGEKS